MITLSKDDLPYDIIIWRKQAFRTVIVNLEVDLLAVQTWTVCLFNFFNAIELISKVYIFCDAPIRLRTGVGCLL